MPMLDPHLVILLIKLAVAASLASLLTRFGVFTRALMQDERTLAGRMLFAVGVGAVYASGVTIRIITPNGYDAVDLGLEGSLLIGLLGGYLAGLVGGILIAVPALPNGELLSLPLYAGVGVIGGLLRDCAPDPEEIWRLTPFLDLNLYYLIRKRQDPRRTLFHLVFFAIIFFVEALRILVLYVFGPRATFSLLSEPLSRGPLDLFALFFTTLLSVTVPLKIWNNIRNERKLEAQQRLLTEARLAALTNQINPHFLFNTLNSINTLVRLNPELARKMIGQLSNILRRLLRKTDGLTPLREELSFIDDYLAIEMVRFGDKLRFQKEVDPATLDRLVPSMLLQPLIENSIKHGLSSKVEGGMIRVRSWLVNGRLCVEVEDDGVGMAEARLAALFEHGIGVSNVNERLKVLFGSNYRLGVDSRPGGGTRTEIEFPDIQALPAAS